jgi:SPP1 gp7 family putative phage head morphogenesis protein
VKVTTKPPGPLPKEALEYFDAKGLSPDIDLDEAWIEEHDLAFAVAGVAADDVLAALKAAVREALAEGLTYQEFAAAIEDVVKALGWWSDGEKAPHRLRVIYDTHMRVARAAGQWARIERTMEARPYLVYALGPAEHHRPAHVTWAGTVLKADDPWWATHFPPNGFNCRCHARQVGTPEARRLGISNSAPAGDPDEGWSRNPGAARGP